MTHVKSGKNLDSFFLLHKHDCIIGMTEFNSNNASTLLARYNVVFFTYHWAFLYQLFKKMQLNLIG